MSLHELTAEQQEIRSLARRFAEVVGQDPTLRQALELAAAIAPSRAPA